MGKPTGRQLAAARALVGLKRDEVAARAAISLSALDRMEAQEGPVAGMYGDVSLVIRILQEAGIAFLEEGDGGGVGVRLTKSILREKGIRPENLDASNDG